MNKQIIYGTAHYGLFFETCFFILKEYNIVCKLLYV